MSHRHFFTNSFHQTERGWHFMVMRQQNLWWRWKSATLVDSDWTFEARHHLRTSKQHLDQGDVRQCGTLGLGQQTPTAIEVCEVWVFFSGFAYSPLQFLSSGVHVQVCTKHSWSKTTEAATSQNKIHMEPAGLKTCVFCLRPQKNINQIMMLALVGMLCFKTLNPPQWNLLLWSFGPHWRAEVLSLTSF